MTGCGLLERCRAALRSGPDGGLWARRLHGPAAAADRERRYCRAGDARRRRRRPGLPPARPSSAACSTSSPRAIGSGVTRTGAASIIAGTWSINQVIIDRPELRWRRSSCRRPSIAIAIWRSSPARPRRPISNGWCASSSPMSMPDGRSPFDVCCDLAAAIEPAADDPDLPSLPLRCAAGRQCARRLLRHRRLAHARGIWCARVLEGVAFGHRQHIETMRKAGARLQRGGAFRRRLAQLRLAADLCRCARRSGLASRARAKPARWGRRLQPEPASACFADFGRRRGRDGADGAALSSERLA